MELRRDICGDEFCLFCFRCKDAECKICDLLLTKFEMKMAIISSSFNNHFYPMVNREMGNLMIKERDAKMRLLHKIAKRKILKTHGPPKTEQSEHP